MSDPRERLAARAMDAANLCEREGIDFPEPIEIQLPALLRELGNALTLAAPAPVGPSDWTNEELHAAASRAAEHFHPHGDGQWNRNEWLRFVLRDLRAVRGIPAGAPERSEMCDRCDGCGWYEGGKAIRTTCEKCAGTGIKQRGAPTGDTS